ncbi:MAG: NAD kinase [Alphaproteobacteria bacterium]
MTFRINFIASQTGEAQEALRRLAARYGQTPSREADVIVALGGDGLMLQALHETVELRKPIYGMNLGSLGFLMNEYREDGLAERLAKAETAKIHPLAMVAIDRVGARHEALAINEVSLLRETRQTAKIRIVIDGRTRLEELFCDGIMLATAAGSTAYNLSAHGPVLPLDSALLALTPISAFRPRRWRGALLPHDSKVRFEILETDKRPVSAVADQAEVRNVVAVNVMERDDISLEMLFDSGRSLKERILAEQFSY